MTTKLTPKQQLFVEEYIKDLNATQAYIRAGYKARGRAAENNASRLLGKNAGVAAAIQERMDRRSERTQVQADDVVRQLVRMGLSDPRRLYDADGNLLPPHKLPEDIAMAVQAVDVIRNISPEGEVTETYKYKLSDRVKPLEMIGKHLGKALGQWAEKLEHTGKDGGPIESVSADLSPEEASKLYRDMLAGR